MYVNQRVLKKNNIFFIQEANEKIIKIYLSTIVLEK